MTLYVQHRFHRHNYEPSEPQLEKQSLVYNAHGEADSNDHGNVANEYFR